jgi:hypothetical protein
MRISQLFSTTVLSLALIGLPMQAFAQSVNQSMKDRAVMDYDYKMYIEGNGGESTNNDALHDEFVLKRNQYLKKNETATPVQTVEPTVVTPAPTPATQTRQRDDFDKIFELLNVVKNVRDIFK